jgi:DNA repair protein RecN (Recombination protein N)
MARSAAMIEELRIQGVGVIDEARLEFAPGLNVITGETGAGKTMILSGLELLRGARMDAGQLRDSSMAAEVDAVVTIDDAHRLALAALEDLAVPADDDPLIIRRTAAPQGKSRAHVAGRPVPLSALADIWQPLIAVHGQADQARLREAVWQREIVDRFAGESFAHTAQSYRRVWDELLDVRRELHKLQSSAEDRERRAALLRLAIAEIDDVAPQVGEDVELDAEAAVLAHAGSLRDAASTARAVLSGTDDDIDPNAVSTRVAVARERLDAASDLDERLGAMAKRLADITHEIVDIDAELGDYLRSLDADPQRQAWVEERRARLLALRKSYGATIEEVLRWREESATEVARVDDSSDRITELTAREGRLVEELRALATSLSAERVRAAGELSQAVESELRALAMPEASVRIDVECDLDAPRAHGADTVTVSLIPHPGAAVRPIGKGASGGELSRLALAFEVAMAGDAPVPTLVFDEVDAGIGGAVAVEVGRRLARLATSTQVIVVTHLPQVAAFADRHLVVTKDTDGSVTAATVREAAGDARVQELVRMLSGLEGSTTGAAHARELLELAAAER